MSSAATDSVLQRQQQQYAEYVRQHQLQRSRGGGGSSSSSSRASSRSVPAPASPLGAGGRSGLAAGVGGQSFDESLLQGGGGGGGGAGGDDYALHQEGEQLQYEDPIFHLADGRQLRGHAAVKARAGIWVQDVVAWPSRSFRSRAIMIVHLALCLAITCWLLQVGVRHLHDDFTDPTVSKTDPNPPTNLCRQLPIFLIGTGAIFLLAIGIIGLLMGLAIWRAHAKLERSVDDEEEDRWSAHDNTRPC